MKNLFAIAFLFICSLQVGAQKKVISKNPDGAWYFPTGNHGLKPGDTVLVTGNVGYAYFEKVIGTPGKEIVFIAESPAHIGVNDKGVLGGYGLLIQNSSYFKVIGNGKLKVGGVNSSKYLAQAVGLHGSSNYEVSGVEAQFAEVGFYSNGTGYHMNNILLHDNIIHDLDNLSESGRTEAFYFGNTGINTTKLFSFNNIKIFRNRMYKLSGDGIQLALAKNYEVYDNYIEDYGRARLTQQNKGIIIGSGSFGRVYNNTVINGSGSPFQCFGAGRNYFENNTAINTCQMPNEDAFYIGNRSPDSATIAYINGNKIDKTSRNFIQKEANTTVYQSGNQFGGTVVVPPPTPTKVDSVTKASYDSLMALYNLSIKALSTCAELYSGLKEKNAEQSAIIDELKLKIAELEAWIRETKTFINRP